MPRSSSSTDKPKPKNSTKPKVPFKHIAYRATGKQKGFVVQHGGKTHGGFHSTLKQACDTLKQVLSKLSPPITVLPRRRLAPVRKKGANEKVDKRSYFGVSYHKRLKRWVGNQAPLGGTFDTAKEAHQALVKKRPSARSRKANARQKVSVAQLIERTKQLMTWGEKGTRLWLPPDLMASFRHAKLSRKMFQAEPALEMLSLHCKYEPWKAALLESWRELGSPQHETEDVAERAKMIQSVSLKAATRIASSPVSPTWLHNANRFRHREQGPTITLRNLGVASPLASREQSSLCPSRLITTCHAR
jgi:hypothetical protein